MDTPTVGRQLRIFRESRNMKQGEFCEYTGIKQQTISGIETGRSEPSTAMLQLLFQKFPDLNPDWLLLGTGEMLRQGRTLTPAAQLPPPVPSEAKPTQPGSGERTMPHMAINAEGEVYWRSVATERLKQIESLEKTVEKLWDQNTTLLKKPNASPDAASLRDTVDDIAHELAHPVGRAVVEGFVMRRLA